MPQYRVQLNNYSTSQKDTVTVWADDKRLAGIQGLKAGRKLLAVSTLEVEKITDLSPAAYKPRGETPPAMPKNQRAPVFTRFNP